MDLIKVFDVEKDEFLHKYESYAVPQINGSIYLQGKFYTVKSVTYLLGEHIEVYVAEVD